MKINNKVLALLSITMVLLTVGLTVNAYDAPYGSDGIFFQVRASNAVALARFVSSDRKQHVFAIDKAIKGKLPASIKINASTHEEAPMVKLVVGQLYLVYLKSNPMTARLGIYNLVMDGMSIRALKPAMAPEYEQVVSDYVAFSGDKNRLAQRLLEVADSKDQYLQYSAVRDLSTVIPPSAAIATALASKLQNGTIRSSDAKLDIVEKIARFRLTAFSPVLESLVINGQENISVRGAGLVTLERMGQTDAVRRVAPFAVNDNSGRLRRIGIDVVKPR